MKIIITGLQYFGSRLAGQLNDMGSEHRFSYYDTYYSHLGRLGYLLNLPAARCVYSINGAVGGSRALSVALRMKKKLVMHWVGSDIHAAENRIKANRHNPEFIRKAVHLTDTPWYVEPLKALGIDAVYQPLLSIDKKIPCPPFPSRFSVLCYVAANNPALYGFEEIIAVARLLPHLTFRIAGPEPGSLPVPSNVSLLGWQRNMQAAISEAVVCLRFNRHDGLSFFVLEALQLGRIVLYNQPFGQSVFVNSVEQVVQQLTDYASAFHSGHLVPDLQNADWVNEQFDRDKVLGNLIKILI